jgi:ArsR family transcriptional regulator, arsenate/arsenite/antimonite-responsive transcriptional repressor
MRKEDGFDTETFFSALADKTRLRLLNLMRDGEVCVCFFAGTLGTNNPKISRHLAYLRKAGLVRGRRDGKWMHYSLQRPSNEKGAAIFDATMSLLEAEPEMVADRRRLVDYCCSPSAPVMISGRARVPNQQMQG